MIYLNTSWEIISWRHKILWYISWEERHLKDFKRELGGTEPKCHMIMILFSEQSLAWQGFTAPFFLLFKWMRDICLQALFHYKLLGHKFWSCHLNKIRNMIKELIAIMVDWSFSFYIFCFFVDFSPPAHPPPGCTECMGPPEKDLIVPASIIHH